MKTEQIVKENFIKDLKTLLKKYDAEVDVTAEMMDLTLNIIGIEIYIPLSYDIDGELIREETIIQLPKWFDHDCI